MKQLYTFLAITILGFNTINAQTYKISTGGSVSTCAGTFYDSGTTANYTNNESYTMTFCSSTPGDQIKFDFTTFNTQANLDILTVYDGNSTSATVIGTYSGNTPFAVNSTTGCLTFKFTSDATTARAGWVAAISCITLDPSICAGAGPFCTGLPITYPASTNAASEFPYGAGCGIFDNPAYYYLKIGTAGNIVINISSQGSNGGNDVDFICWGPFTNPTSNCIAGLDDNSYTSMNNPHTPPPAGTNIVDCSFSIDATENCYINNATIGQYYLLCIANYANVASNITFNQTNSGVGAGATDCSIVIPCDISALTANPSACNTTNNQYSVSGSITFNNPPTTGTLTVSDGNGHSQTFNPPFNSPQAFTLTGLTSDGASHNITASFSATTCTKTTSYNAPSSCITCSVEAGAAGTITCIQNTSGIAIGEANDPAKTYSWSPVAGLSNSVVSSPTANPVTSTTYTVTCTTTSTGCTATDNVVVTVNKTLPSSEAGSAGTITCTQNLSGITIGTTNNAAYTYIWNPTSDLSSSSISNPTATPTATTTYTVTTTSTANGCSSSDNVVITFDKVLPISEAGNAGTITCIQNTNGLVIGAANLVAQTYLWNPSLGLSSPTLSNPNANPTATTTYTVTTTTTANGCSSTDNVIVTVDKILPISEAGNAGTITCTQNLSGVSIGTTNNTAYTYIWNPSSDLSNSTIPNPVATPTATTTYTVTTTTTANGCSSSDNVVITVDKILPNSEAGNAGTITCTQNLSGVSIGATNNTAYTYIWNPTSDLTNSTISNPIATPTATTTYIVTTTSNSNGCTATDNVIVSVDKVLPISEAGNAGTITCIQNTNGLVIGAANLVAQTYLWNPSLGLSSPTLSNPNANPTATTTYTVTTTTTANGCSSTDNVIVTVDKILPISEAGNAGTITCTQNLSGITIGATNNTAYTYIWNPTSDLSSSSISNPTATPTATTTYTVTTTNSLSLCTATDNVVIAVNKIIPLAEAGPDKTITCLIPSVVLDGTLSESGTGIDYSWSGSILFGELTKSPVVNLSGTYVLTVTNSNNGCFATDSVLVSLNNTPPNINVSAPISICKGNSANLSASGGNSYSWSPTIGLANSLISNPIVNPTITTTYIVAVIGLNGCSNTADVVVTVNPIPTISILPNSPSICQGSSIDLNAISDIAGATTYIWAGYSGNSTITVSPNANTTYYVTGTANNCSSSAMATVSVEPIPTVNLGADVSICEGNSTLLNAGNTNYNYYWSTQETTPIISVSAAGNYSVTVSSALCGTAIDSINLSYLSMPSINLGNDFTGCIDNIIINVPDIYASYLWSTGNTTAEIIANSANSYSLSVTDNNGCKSSDTIVLIDSCFSDMFIPNCFTPNGDNKNDNFRVVAQNISAFTIYIFNRWGQKIYESNDIENGWDGRMNGNICPSGTYYYIIDYADYHSVKYQKSGSVTILL
ncbi:MAG: gliding motility-associated C-terminal domain-containing protein [Bacteroidota bacterium]